MPTYYEIPTSSDPQTFSIQLAGVTYNMHLTYHEANAENQFELVGFDSSTNTLIDTNTISSWILDIFDSDNNPVVLGLPLIPGIDLLYQYQYLNLGGSLVVSTEASTNSVPTFAGLGESSHLYFVTFP
jgi:hypothetical protein